MVLFGTDGFGCQAGHNDYFLFADSGGLRIGGGRRQKVSVCRGLSLSQK